MTASAPAFGCDLDQVVLEGARLLLGVARLGDGDLRRWWNSSALDPDVGGYLLPAAFPRTGRVAAAQLLLLSAERRHSMAVSRRNAVHLFSDQLPFRRWTWSWLAAQKTRSETHPLIAELEGWQEQVAAARLAEWAGPKGEGELVAGIVDLGQISPGELGVLGRPGDPLRLLARARQLAAWYVDMASLTPPLFNLASTSGDNPSGDTGS
ncbi:MAG: BrxE family protein [Acidimicrobiales bacterium]